MKYSISSLPHDLLNEPICFFFPSKIIGGHELMAIELIKQLYEKGKSISVAYLSQNEELKERVSKNGIDIDFMVINLKQPRFEFLHALFNFYYCNQVDKSMLKMDSFASGNIVVVQGDIELGAAYINSAKKNNIDLYSYIPYAHSAKKMNKALAFFRDLYYPVLYKKVKNYITISEQFKKELISLNSNSNVYIVENNVRCLDDIKNKRQECCDKSDMKYEIAIVGRISLKQKGHDKLILALAQLPTEISDKIRLHIVGDGKDLKLLKNLVSKNCANLSVVYHGWCKEPWEKIYHVDLIVIPSRFEGVPLVMLESIELRIDVLASNIDGMIDYLDSEKLFDSIEDLGEKIKKRIVEHKDKMNFSASE
ncbi:glycosyltransferase [Erwinia sp. INIA-01]|uniref:glycosyltransferase n=1 Tax=Erwinia sp. INIA01 TaxID=2991500 RepID=UPI002224A0E7|nr:glycosyltransferase [Erwinia sp. INIA01]MCW1874112.1 glycosyltransferase [Erwinia sp. INIA01]